MDLFYRRVVGWRVSSSLHSDLALDALEHAVWQRRREGRELLGLVHHADRGVQYRAIRYTERLEELGIVASVGSKGDSLLTGNAAAEALNRVFKTELIRPTRALEDPRARRTRGPAMGRLVQQDPPHTWCGYLAPAAYERAHYAAHDSSPATVEEERLTLH
jgi:putative transposase